MNPFEIDSRIETCLSNLFDAETGEINEEVEAELNALELEREEKVDAWCFWLEAEEGEMVTLEKAIANLEDKLARKKKRHDRSKEHLMNYLQGEKFKSTTHSVSYRTTKSIKLMPEIEENPLLLPEQFVSCTLAYKPMKKELKKAIEDGESISGVWIEEKTSMVIK